MILRFQSVELDEANVLLRVDGQVRSCPSKAFELLQLLANRPNRLMSRTELQELLWPGGQVVSDEALTQVIFRARAAIEPHARLIQTVRGKGLRLNTDVSRIDITSTHWVSDPTETDMATPQRPSHRSLADVHQGFDGTLKVRKKQAPGIHLAAAIALVALLLLAGNYWPARDAADSPAQLLDPGYGLYFEDVQADHSETSYMIAEAFKNEAVGDRKRAELLLEAVHGQDSRTPVPALFLALWSRGDGNMERAEFWLDQSRQRLQSNTSVYLRLLKGYIEAEVNGSPQRVVDQAGALLDVRPDAWRMHQARAHLMEYQGMREAALHEIQQIPVTRLGDRKLELVIADRASFGDVNGAQALLDQLGPESHPAAHAYLSGRVAWSRGDWPAALDSFSSAVTMGYQSARLDIYRRSLIYASALEVLLGRDGDAIRRCEQARMAASGTSTIDEVDISLLLAQLYAEMGDFERMNDELDHAMERVSPNVTTDMALASGLVSFRLRPDAIQVKPMGLAPEYEALWLGFEKYSQGFHDAAISALAESRQLGIHLTRMSDEARWLEQQLQQPVAPESILDPPYPPLSRVILRRQISQNMLTHN